MRSESKALLGSVDAGMSDTVVRVRGTDDVAEIAAVLAAISARPVMLAQPSGYDRWRADRVVALRRSRRR